MRDTTGRFSRAHVNSSMTLHSSDQSHRLTMTDLARLLMPAKKPSSASPEADVKTSEAFRVAIAAAATRPSPLVPPDTMTQCSNAGDNGDIEDDGSGCGDPLYPSPLPRIWRPPRPPVPQETRRSAANRSRHTSTANSVSMSSAENSVSAGTWESRTRMVGMCRRRSCSIMLAIETPSCSASMAWPSGCANPSDPE